MVSVAGYSALELVFLLLFVVYSFVLWVVVDWSVGGVVGRFLKRDREQVGLYGGLLLFVVCSFFLQFRAGFFFALVGFLWAGILFNGVIFVVERNGLKKLFNLKKRDVKREEDFDGEARY